jgi:hypothetical protein
MTAIMLRGVESVQSAIPRLDRYTAILLRPRGRTVLRSVLLRYEPDSGPLTKKQKDTIRNSNRWGA